jgi:hypothetical protein
MESRAVWREVDFLPGAQAYLPLPPGPDRQLGHSASYPIGNG